MGYLGLNGKNPSYNQIINKSNNMKVITKFFEKK